MPTIKDLEEKLHDEVAELKRKDEEQGGELERLALQLGTADEISEMKRGARQGALAWKFIMWAGGVAGAAVITAFVVWLISGGTKTRTRPIPTESIVAPSAK